MSIAISDISMISSKFENPAAMSQPLRHEVGKNDWFDPKPYFGKQSFRYLSNPVRYCVAASKQLNPIEQHDLQRIGVIIGTNLGDYCVRRDMHNTMKSGGTQDLNSIYVTNSSINLAASYISIDKGYFGPNMTLTSPWTAGIESLYMADKLISRGILDCVITGACEDMTDSEGHILQNGGAGLIVCEEVEKADTTVEHYAVLNDFSIHFHCSKNSDQIVDELLKKQKADGIDDTLLIIGEHFDLSEEISKHEKIRTSFSIIENVYMHSPYFAAYRSLLPVFQLIWLIINKKAGLVLCLNQKGNNITFTLNYK